MKCTFRFFTCALCITLIDAKGRQNHFPKTCGCIYLPRS